jgi:sugar-specific transcriptional regulator TrmB
MSMVLEGYATTMSEQTIASLTEFGLTSLQARIYVALLNLGVVRASQVSTNVGVVRPEVYRVLRELLVKGLVQKNIERPATYSAIAPGRALSALRKRLRDKLVFLNKKQEELAAALSSVSAKTSPQIERFSMISGGENAVARNIQMVREAQEDYSAIMTRFGLSRARDNGLVRAIVSAKRRKIRVRIISEIDSSNSETASYLAQRVELRATRDLLFYMDIVDCSQMLFGPAFPASDKELGERQSDLWTNSRKFVRGMHGLFERFWAESNVYHSPAAGKRITRAS